MKKLILSVFCFITGISSVSAQGWCGTVDHEQSLIENQPEKAAALKERIQQFNQLQRANSANGIKNNDHYIVPVVFHVIHEGGTENISFEQIEDQMRILNEDFARLNSDAGNTPNVFAQYAGDTNIEFRLAKIDPDGNCTQGVTRTFSNLTNEARNNVKSLIQWDPQRYMNVWVVRTIESFSRIIQYTVLASWSILFRLSFMRKISIKVDNEIPQSIKSAQEISLIKTIAK